MRAAILLAALLLTGCTSVRLPAAEQAGLDPIAFFAGRSHGTGSLSVVFSSPVPIGLESIGTPQWDGLLLRQTIHEGAKPPRVRDWRIRRDGPNRYSGTLTEAEGPVTLTTRGPRAFVTYRTKDGTSIRQQLALQSDERTILNHLKVFKIQG